jgi:hypothetical protein
MQETDRVQNKVAKFAHQKKDLNCKAYTGERARKAISDRLQKPCYLSRVDQIRKLGAGNRRHMSENIYSSGNSYLQML